VQENVRFYAQIVLQLCTGEKLSGGFQRGDRTITWKGPDFTALQRKGLPALVGLLQRCWDKTFAARPTLATILEEREALLIDQADAAEFNAYWEYVNTPPKITQALINFG
jgi:hypothetical protein